MKIESKKFSNREITVTYDAAICKLSCKCSQELSEVFMSSVIPWVDLDAATPERIKQQVEACPSGALKFNKKKDLRVSLKSDKKEALV